MGRLEQQDLGAFRDWALTRFAPPSTTQAPTERDSGGRAIVPKLPRSPDTGESTDLIIADSFAWDVPAVLGALSQHDQGQFSASSMLADFMLRDDRFSSCLGTRVLGVQGLPFECKPSDEKKLKARKVADALAEDWPWICTPAVLEEALEWELRMGFALFEIVWDTSGDRWIPTLKLWHPQFIWYHLWLRKYVAICQEGLVYVTPGDGKWLLFSRHEPYRAWIHGCIRDLWMPWMARQYDYRDWARFNEVHGLPIKQAVVPFNSSPSDKQTFFQQIAQLGARGVIQSPRNREGDAFMLELLSAANGDASVSFEKLMMRADANITMRLLGNNLSGGEVQGGSLAAAKEGGSVRDDYKLSDVTALSHCFKWQAIRPWTVFNFGDEDLTPSPEWDAKPPEDKGRNAQTFYVTMQAVQIAQAVGVTVDVEQLVEKYELPIDATAEIVPPPVPPQLPSGKPTAPTDTKPPALTLSRRRAPDPQRWAIAGQLHADATGDSSLRRASKAMRADVLAVVNQILDDTHDYDQLRVRLAQAFPDLNVTALNRITEGALKLAIATGAFTGRSEAHTE